MQVRWNVDFKSDWVARNVIQNLAEAEDIEIRRQIDIFRRIPRAGKFVGRLLEPLVHRFIANVTDGFWTLINMKFNEADLPHFILHRDSPVPDDVRFIKVKRKIVKLQAITDLSTCLENNYYVPEDPDFPLFDAFIIELDHAKKLAVLWILQMTTLRRHEGSTMGYRTIQEIIAILKDELLKDPPVRKEKAAQEQATPMPPVQVRYLHVVPKGEPELQQWQFPKG